MLAFCSLFGAGTVRCQQWHGAQQLLATWWRGDQFSECATGQSLASFDKDSIQGFWVKAGTTGYRKYMFECNRVPACRDELFGRCDNILVMFSHQNVSKCHVNVHHVWSHLLPEFSRLWRTQSVAPVLARCCIWHKSDPSESRLHFDIL